MEPNASAKFQYAAKALAAAVVALLCFTLCHPQEAGWKVEEARKQGVKMLKTVKEQIKRSYYDKDFHGVDIDARFKLAENKMSEAKTSSQVFGIIAQAVVDLDDSHTLFVPPLRDSIAIYGWRMQMIGESCYITAVMPGSDAEVKGLMPGDRIIDLDGYEPTRENLWKIQYYYYSLRPQSRVQITVQSPLGGERKIEILTRLQKRHLFHAGDKIVDLSPFEVTADDGTGSAPRYFESGPDLIVCRLPSFNIDDDEVDGIMERITGHKTLILDLRGNRGGRSVALMRFAGYFFEQPVKIAELKMRDGMKEEKVKPSIKNSFKGKLIVLVDSRSASAAEVFARVTQLERRGMVIGDQTSGKVMQSLRFHFQLGSSAKPVLYSLTVTNADIIMSDGKSLEHVGVTPDEVLLPTATDLRNRSDPVLARAASITGVNITPEKAGSLFSQTAISSQ